tara:strand:- start:56246 stop:57703 length:1458 start_codon:yes stop_codon:yes gene_type:complete
MADKTTPPKPEVGEISAVGRGDLFGGYIAELAQPSDPLLRSIGGDMSVYEKVQRDEQVQTTLQQRRRAVTSLDWSVEPGGDAPIDKAAANDLKEQLDALSWDRITDKMLWGIFYGYAVAELLYEIDGNRVRLSDIRVRDRKRFRFGHDRSLRLLTGARPEGIVMPDRKFWTFTAGGDNDDEVYGRGLAYWLYWPVYLKRNGVKFWAIVLEKFGQPTTIGKYDASATPEDRQRLLSAIRAAATDVGIIIPKGMEIEFLEAQRRAGGDHHIFAEYMDAAITKVVLSQTMTTEDGSSRSQAEVHLDVRDDVVESDADLACESFNAGPARWLSEWNFPGAIPPRVWRLTDNPEDLNTVAERDKKLHEMGYQSTPARVAETYGPGYERVNAPTDPGPAVVPDDAEATFAEGADRDTADDLADQLDVVAAPAMDDMIDQIRELVGDVSDLQELADRLIEIYPDLDDGALAEVMRAGLTVADLSGRAEVSDG